MYLCWIIYLSICILYGTVDEFVELAVPYIWWKHSFYRMNAFLGPGILGQGIKLYCVQELECTFTRTCTFIFSNIQTATVRDNHPSLGNAKNQSAHYSLF
jgi:hypothetical protein